MAIIGAGRAGTALAVLLERAGHLVVAVSGGPASAERARHHLPRAAVYPRADAHLAALAASVVVLGVPDDRIAEVCSELASNGAFGPGRFVLHLSGAVGLDALDPARAAGSEVLSLHPLQSFPSVEEGVARLPGSAIAVTGATEAAFVEGEALASEAGGQPFRLAEHAKPLYHAAAVFCANYLVAVEALAERLFRLAGVPDPVPKFAPLARAALEGVLARGAQDALTGPAARGDAGTVRRNLEALGARAPEAVAPYVVLARAALRLASQGGGLSPEAEAAVAEVLDAWS